ncbi:mitotic spindle checkpoint protein BUBR1-like [Asparagus officinalis]|uniref:mitotic spindle checkpoint protein BUBR1-like n=1 Tax=Asparagus officinalis TaxID=4686 RepID=UPI00098E124E|nr:mitotic spindle checkpoint protein BUBR1-like [Asparagus officinalis]
MKPMAILPSPHVWVPAGAKSSLSAAVAASSLSSSTASCRRGSGLISGSGRTCSQTAINKPLSIYNDENAASRCQPENQKSNDSSWRTLGSRADRNKENTSAPTVWSSYKVPYKTGTRVVPTPSSMRIEVFVDKESAEYMLPYNVHICVY